jgi:hypothetical protein
MISWLSVSPEDPVLPESDEDASLGGGGMNWTPELDALALVVLELALVDEALLACSICMRIERPDPPTPLTDMRNSRIKGRRPRTRTVCRGARADRRCIREFERPSGRDQADLSR